jgi:hypothetical protein
VKRTVGETLRERATLAQRAAPRIGGRRATSPASISRDDQGGWPGGGVEPAKMAAKQCFARAIEIAAVQDSF